MGHIDHRAEVREFLSSRRARITPQQAGLPAARALQLDEAECDHLFSLARAAGLGPRRRTPAATVRPVIQQVLDAVTDAPAWVRNGRHESEVFRRRWASHDVQFHRSGRKRLRHPVVGQLDLDFESMELPSEPGLTLNVYTAAPGSPTADGLKMHASWAATQDLFIPER
jgi:hypothetical protein